MSQQPPGPFGESDDDRTPHEGEPDHGAPEEQPTESLDRSPYDVPETDVPETGAESPSEEETSAYPAAAPYGQAPDPSRTIYSGTTDTEPEPEHTEGDGRRRWVLPVVIAAVVLLVAGGIAAALLLGGDDEEPAPVASTTPAAEATTPAGESATPTEEPTDAATTPAPTQEPTGPDESLVEDLDTSVAVGDVTFELTGEGFTPDTGIQGAVEAVRGVYAAGDERIEMLATTWPDNAAADAFAARLVEGADGEEVETGSTYTNGTGTFWAYVLSDGRGRYIWTTDRGHVLEVTGSPEYVGGFYSAFPL